LITTWPVLAVERAGRLVGEQQLRLLGDAAGDRHALLLAARELGGPLAQLVLHADFHQGVGGALAGGLPGTALVLQDDLDLLQGGQRREQVEALEDEAAVVEPEAVQLAERRLQMSWFSAPTLPSSGRSRPEERGDRGRLAEPDGPMTMVTSPWLASKSTRFSTSMCVRPVLKRL
jgi:hypothetical protein